MVHHFALPISFTLYSVTRKIYLYKETYFMKKQINRVTNNTPIIDRNSLRKQLIDAATDLFRKSWNSYNDLNLYIDPDTCEIYETDDNSMPYTVWNGHDLFIIGYKGGPDSLLTDGTFEPMIDAMNNWLTEADLAEIKAYQEQNDCNLSAYEDLFPELYQEVLKEFQDEALELEQEHIEENVNRVLNIFYPAKNSMGQ